MKLLGTIKDKTVCIQKSRMYSIKCGDCDGVLFRRIGQTKESISVHSKEHSGYIKHNQGYC